MAGLDLTDVIHLLAAAGLIVAIGVVLVLTAMMLRVRRLRRRGAEARHVAAALVALARENQPLPPRRTLRVDQRTLGDVMGQAMDGLDGPARGRVITWLRREGFVSGALHHMGSRHPWTRALAASQLGHMRATEGVSALTAALRDPDSEVRVAAVLALADVLGDGAIPAISDAVRDGTLPDRVALAALKRLGPSAAPDIAGLLADRSALVRRVAAAAVAHRGDRQSAPALLARVLDTDPEVRRRVIAALFVVDGLHAPERLRRALVAGALDPLPAIRAASAAAIGALLGRDGEPLLRMLARDPDFWVVARARAALRATDGTATEGYSTLPAGTPWPEEHRVRLREALGDAQALGGVQRSVLPRTPALVG